MIKKLQQESGEVITAVVAAFRALRFSAIATKPNSLKKRVVLYGNTFLE
ncbi:MAG: hypothetical protein KKG34_03030 [Proteobacteria bacterium]|nr:hypothetical protein [Pseudomonadota bacterium]MBU4033751.1 hypothetical protein [Pseudomonadota bacterium]